MNSKFRYYIYKLRSLPLRVVIKKAFCKIKDKGLCTIGKILATAFGAEMTDRGFLKKIHDSSHKFQNLEELQKHFRERKEPRFLVDSSKQKGIVSTISEHFPDIPDEIVAEANKICEHIFNLLGSGKVNIGKKIDWHSDFKTKYRWNPKRYYKDIKIPYGKADTKVPWELSRFHHLSTLGQAYWLTNDDKYAREFVNQINDWMDNNKPKFGVNWRCTMDVAIRVVNWIWGYYFFKDSKEITDEFLLKFLKTLLIHGRHITKNLEYGKVITNHYLSNIAGLACLGIMFPEFEEAKKWLEFSKNELEKEMFKQVYSDGMDFEASTCYHRLALELFLYPALIGQRNNVIFSQRYMERLKRMFDFILYVLKPNGKMPQIGDNDSGRFLKFETPTTEILDMKYLLPIASVFFNDPSYNVDFGDNFGYGLPVLWLFGKENFEKWIKMPKRDLCSIRSQSFNDSGLYIMRNGKNYMVISCGPNGQGGNGGHAHNDKLSFELYIDGKDIIVDPGTYVYTPDPGWRNRFRSTGCHNTIAIDKEEQNRFDERTVFTMKDDAMAKCLKWESNEEYDLFLGEHYGYKRLSNPVVHQREIRYCKKQGKWEIIDRLKGKGKHNLEWNFILSPEFKQELKIHSDQLQWHKQPAFYSKEYGTMNKTQKFTATLKTKIPFEVKFEIEKGA